MRRSTATELAETFRISTADSLQAIWKAKLISEIRKAAEKRDLTHAEIAKKSGVPRSAVTGILNGSLQKVPLNSG